MVIESATPSLPMSTVGDGFLFVEKLLRKALRFVPYADEHLKVWSPRFATIILEAGSQFSSLLHATAVADGHLTSSDRSDVGNYREWYGKVLAPQWAILFLGDTQPLLAPFNQWRKSSFAASDNPNMRLPWWESYNALKHDRLANAGRATLECAAQSVAALFLSIVYSGQCDSLLINGREFTVGHSMLPLTLPSPLRDAHANYWITVESRLFGHPIAWCDKPVTRDNSWDGAANDRYKSWWRTYCAANCT
jgi:hypothetical protein